jgi:hypothetical protein
MATWTPVYTDPFAAPAQSAAANGSTWTPVDNDPFAQSGSVTPPPGQTMSATPDRGWLGTLDDGVRMLTNKIPFSDRFAAGMDTLTGTGLPGADYATNLQAERAKDMALDSAHPWLSKALGYTGGGAAALATLPEGAVAGGSTMLGRALSGAGAGATYGAVQGASDTPDLTNIPDAETHIAAGATLGAGLGAAAVPVGAVAGKVAGSVSQKLADALFARTNGSGLTPDAADALIRAFQMQGQTPSDALAAAQNLGTGATLADTGQATRDLTARLAAREPSAAPIIADNLTSRADNLAPRINQAVTDLAGPDFNAVDALSGLKARTAANGAAGYGPVLNSGATVDVTPVRDMIAQTRVDPIAEGVTEDPISQALARAQGLFVGRTPEAVPIKLIHNAQMAIGDQASAAMQSGNFAQARALTSVRNGLLDQMPDAYNAARQQYASDKAIEDAFTEGRSILASRSDGQVFDPDLLQARLNGMSNPEVSAYQLGARKALTDVMGQARSDPAGIAGKLANENGYAADKLRTLFGDQPVSGLLDELDKQAQIRATNNLALGGSKTAMASAADGLIPTAAKVGAVGHGSGTALSMLAGSEFGGHLGRALGNETAGSILGASAGTLWNGVAAPIINSGRQASQDASRLALARALTAPPTSALATALERRGATAGFGATSSNATSALARALTTTAPQQIDPATKRMLLTRTLSGQP